MVSSAGKFALGSLGIAKDVRLIKRVPKGTAVIIEKDYPLYKLKKGDRGIISEKYTGSGHSVKYIKTKSGTRLAPQEGIVSVYRESPDVQAKRAVTTQKAKEYVVSLAKTGSVVGAGATRLGVGGIKKAVYEGPKAISQTGSIMSTLFDPQFKTRQGRVTPTPEGEFKISENEVLFNLYVTPKRTYVIRNADNNVIYKTRDTAEATQVYMSLEPNATVGRSRRRII